MFLSNILRLLIIKVSRILPVKRNKILFVSHLGKNYSCNPKYICEYLLKSGDTRFELVYLYDPTNCNPNIFPKAVRPLNIYSRRFLYDIATCGFIVSNTRIPEWFGFYPRRKQIYLQTWHSSLRLKKIEKDANLGPDYEVWAKSDSKKISVIISGCTFSSQIFRNSFWYSGKILEIGTPRIDYLLNLKEEDVLGFMKKASLDSDFHYLLYAPTFRRAGDTTAYNIDYKLLINSLEEKFGGKWRILFRLHPNLKDVVDIDSLPSCCIDMSGYDDIQELIAISDIMITDYSSCMFDMAFIGKLCILYASDLEQYIKNERNLYFDIASLPFPLAKNNGDLNELIKLFNANDYKSKLSKFMNEIGSFEKGTACGEILNFIVKNK